MPWNRTQTDGRMQILAFINLPQPDISVVSGVTAATAFEQAIHKAASQANSETLSRISVMFGANVAAGSGNFQTLTVRQWRAGALVGTIANSTPVTTVAAKAAHTEFTLISAPAVVLPGDVITVQSVATGTGEALPQMTFLVEYSPDVTGQVVA